MGRSSGAVGRWLDCSWPPLRSRRRANVKRFGCGCYLRLFGVDRLGCALMCDDVTVDFLATPMSAVPLMLEGHREIAKLDMDETAEARIVWRRIVSILSDICSNPQTNYSWYNRPIARMADLLLFFVGQQNSRWRELAPP